MTPNDVGRIIEKLDQVVERIAVLETKLDTHETHDSRLSSLERWRAFLTGVVAIIFFEMQAVSVYIAVSGGK